MDEGTFYSSWVERKSLLTRAHAEEINSKATKTKGKQKGSPRATEQFERTVRTLHVEPDHHTVSKRKREDNHVALSSRKKNRNIAESEDEDEEDEDVPSTITQPKVNQSCLGRLIGIGREKYAKITLWNGEIKIDIRKYETKEKKLRREGSAEALLEMAKTVGVADEEDHIRVKKSQELSPTIAGVSLFLDQLNKLLPILQENKTQRWAKGSAHIEPKHHFFGKSLYAFCYSKSPDSYTCLELRYCHQEGNNLKRSKKKGIHMDDEEAVYLTGVLETFHRIIYAGSA